MIEIPIDTLKNRVIKQFVDYFENIDRIDDYLRKVKIEKISKIGINPLFPLEDDFFDCWDMHPNDMNFSWNIEENNQVFNNYLAITTSHAIEESIPGKTIRIIVRETNTNKIVGFIRLGSPLVNSKPRNEWLGMVPNLSLLNRHTIMGFIIVPTQPFGYNYLGGKLLSLLCCSHEVREEINKKYEGTNICCFETTSLYGSTKSSSQYDGLKPYMRFKGLTDSDFLPLLPGPLFKELEKVFKDHMSNDRSVTLVKKDASSRKLKTQQKMIAIIKSNLKNYPEELQDFQDSLIKFKNLTEKKRVYMSDYGFSNSREVLRGDQVKLEKNPVNYDKFYFDNMVQWWKNKSSNRFDSLKNEGRLRRELEIWTKDMEIDIIR